MRSGRFFIDENTANSLPVAAVNKTFVNRYSAGDVLGRQFRYGHGLIVLLKPHRSGWNIKKDTEEGEFVPSFRQGGPTRGKR